MATTWQVLAFLCLPRGLGDAREGATGPLSESDDRSRRLLALFSALAPAPPLVARKSSTMAGSVKDSMGSHVLCVVS